MGSSSKRPLVASNNVYIHDLLREILSGTRQVNEILICSSRDEFVDQLVSYICAPHTANTEQETDAADDRYVCDPNLLLHPTLQLLTLSDRIRLSFCPTISIFRAQLARLLHEAHPETPRLLILNVLLLHHDTSEFTLQGLSRTFAAVASLSVQFTGSVELIECLDIHENSGRPSGLRLWDAEVPLLSSSIKIKEAGLGWARRLCPIKRIAARWFNFQHAAEGMGD